MKHHFVMVHGACHGSWCWYKVKPRLEAAGYRVTVVDLAASGTDMRTIESISTCHEYSEPLMKILGSSSSSSSSSPSPSSSSSWSGDEKEKVVLVGHSFGGLSLAMAMDKFPDKISVAIFVAAFMPDTNNPPSFVIDKVVP